MKLRDHVFEVLERADDALHNRGFTWVRLCRLVGRMEIGYYDRTINWNEPLFVHPERQPDLYAQHRSDLCEHGYRITTTSRGYHGECPDGCKAATA